MAPSKQVEPTGQSGQLVQYERADRFAQMMRMRAQADKADNTGVGMVPGVNKLLEVASTATSEDEIFDQANRGGIPSGDEMVDIEIDILDVQIFESKGSEISNPLVGDTYLLVWSRRMENGQDDIWNTSATMLVTTIMSIIEFRQRRDLPTFPIEGVVVRGTDLGAGKQVLKLQRVPKRAVSQ